LGFEYKIKKQFGAFINLNNIFGKNYERWHNYPVYGFNVLGGLSLQF
jgi:outer membrane receptor protein involved in Fe transport